MERATQRRKRVSKTVENRQFILTVPKGIESEEGIKSNRSQPPTTPILPSIVTKKIATKRLKRRIVIKRIVIKNKEDGIDIYCIAITKQAGTVTGDLTRFDNK